MRSAGLRFEARPRTEDLWYCSPWHKWSTFRWFHPKEGEVVIDVGANIGTYSLSAAKAGARVIAIEPNPATFESLVKHMRYNSLTRSVTPMRVALGSLPGTGRLFLPESSTGTASLLPDWAHVNDIDPRSAATVTIVPMDSIVLISSLPRVDWMLIDVEGYEVEVLKGAIGTLQRTRRMIIEVGSGSNSERCESLLRESGFQIMDKGSWSQLNEYWLAENTGKSRPAA